MERAVRTPDCRSDRHHQCWSCAMHIKILKTNLANRSPWGWMVYNMINQYIIIFKQKRSCRISPYRALCNEYLWVMSMDETLDCCDISSPGRHSEFICWSLPLLSTWSCQKSLKCSCSSFVFGYYNTENKPLKERKEKMEWEEFLLQPQSTWHKEKKWVERLRGKLDCYTAINSYMWVLAWRTCQMTGQILRATVKPQFSKNILASR